MKYFILVLLLLICSPIYSSQRTVLDNPNTNRDSVLNSNSQILHSQDGSQYDKQSDKNQNLLMMYNQTEKREVGIELNQHQTFEYSLNSNFSAELNITSSKINKFHSLEQLGKLIEMENNGNLDLESTPQELIFRTINPTTQSTRKLTLNEELDGSSTINITLSLLDFRYSANKFAVSYVKFVFNEFELTIAFQYSAKYTTITSNSTGRIKILANTLNYRINLHELALISGETNPTLLTEVIWGVASEELFNYTAVFSGFSLISNIENSSMFFNDSPLNFTIGANIYFANIDKIQIDMGDELYKLFLTLSISVRYENKTLGEIHIRDEYLAFSSEIEFNFQSNFLDYYLDFPEDLEIENITSQSIEFVQLGKNRFEVHSQVEGSDTIILNAKLPFTKNQNILRSSPLQGSKLDINLTGYSESDILLFSPMRDILNLTRENTNTYFEIPEVWPQGLSALILWDISSWLIYPINFEKSFPILVSEEFMSSSPGLFFQYQVLLFNSSSNSIWKPELIQVELPNLMNHTFEQGIITFDPTLLPGDYRVTVEVVNPYIVSTEIQLQYTVESFLPHAEIQITRENIKEFNLMLNVSEFLSWEVKSTLNIETKSLNINETLQSPFQEFKIRDNALGEINESIILTFILGKNIESESIVIFLPNIVKENSNAGIEVKFLIGVTAVLSPVLYYTTTYIRSNYFQKSLSF